MANCLNCGAPMTVDRGRGLLECAHCGSQRERPAILDHLEFLETVSNSCPVCSTPLSSARVDGHRVLCCSRCFGMLIDMDRFTTVIEAFRAREEGSFRAVLPRKQQPGDRVIPCPACSQPMLSHVYGGPGNVVIDTCERCLVNWLDAGELRRIAIAPDRSS